MKNMRIKSKLLLGFILVAFLAAIAGGVGVWGLIQTSDDNTNMYERSVLSMQYLGSMLGTLQEQRVAYRNAILYAGDTAQQETARQYFYEKEAQFSQAMKDYSTTLNDKAEEQLYEKLVESYKKAVPEEEKILNLALAGDIDGARAMLDIAVPLLSAVTQDLDNIATANAEFAKKTSDNNTSAANMLIVIQIAVVAFAVIIGLILGITIARSISTPIKKLVAAADSIAAGDIQVDVTYESKNELGSLAQAFQKMVFGIEQQAELVESIATGDLTVDVPIRSPKDSMNIALKKMVDANNEAFTEIALSSANVSQESANLSNGSQMLAQGATEQAAAVEELSSSISDIAKMTRSNAEMALKANSLAKLIMSNAEKGNEQMGNMMEAVEEINTASQSISKVIKAIDDIAFQTNILALNAAVEAARAGQHGKGFAVVAEEVRSLAGRSAEAAKDTADLIANSIEKAKLGSRIAADTAASLKSIVEGISESSNIVDEIATYSNDQAIAIEQVNRGIDQVAQVVQANSATSQESAASASEMSDQAIHLSEMLRRFKLKGPSSLLPKPKPERAIPERVASQDYDTPIQEISASSDSFGKY